MTNDLCITEVAAGNLGGLIGIAAEPGKPQPQGGGTNESRDLAEKLDSVAEWNAAAVVTFLGTELLQCDGTPIGVAVRDRFMEWHHLPISDVGTAAAAFEEKWSMHATRLCALISAGNRVLVYHGGGLGRMVAARLLVEMGADPDQAIIAAHRGVKPEASEMGAQAGWARKGLNRDDHVYGEAGARDRALGALLGLAVGDAIGTTIEFSPKPTRAVLHDMVGGGPFGLDAGQWTDDTSMALALGDSLLACSSLDPDDLMRRFVSWHRDGAYSCTSECFDIGSTTASALRRYERTGEPFAGSTAPDTAGNGSIMRFAPVAVRHWRDPKEMLRVAQDQSRTTHGAPEAIKSCEILGELLSMAIRGTTLPELVSSKNARDVRGFRTGQPRREVQGSGYVVESLHAALWAVSRTSNYRDAVLMAANLGRDADTTAAIAGQIAGALYGASAIPVAWLDRLAWRERIERIASDLFDAGSAPGIALG